MNGPPRASNFDEVLKEQIKETDQLKANLREKTEEALSLKFLVEELERRLETMRSQFESEKTKLLSEEKSGSKALEYNYEHVKQ